MALCLVSPGPPRDLGGVPRRSDRLTLDKRVARAVAARFSRRAPSGAARLDGARLHHDGADAPPARNPPPFWGGFFVVRVLASLEGHSSAFLEEPRKGEPLRPSWRSGASVAVLKRKVEGGCPRSFPRWLFLFGCRCPSPWLPSVRVPSWRPSFGF